MGGMLVWPGMGWVMAVMKGKLNQKDEHVDISQYISRDLTG